MNDMRESFLTNTDETGRMIVHSTRTGKTYAVEAIGTFKTNWGDMDPATKKTTGSYGNKYRGAIDAEDSMITEENGFIKIQNLKPGTSPIGVIEKLDAKYPTV